MPIRTVNRLYAHAKDRTTHCQLLFHAGLEEFFNAKTLITPLLKTDSEDKYIIQLKSILSPLSFEFANCPLYFSDNYFYREGRLEKIDRLVKILSQFYPGYADNLQRVQHAIKTLSESLDNPILESIEREIGFTGATLVLIKPDYIHAVTEMRDSLGLNLGIISAGTLSPSSDYSRIILCGCAKFFPSHLFWAPKASAQNLFRYGWFNDNLPIFPEIYGAKKEAASPVALVKKDNANAVINSFEAEAEELDEDIDISLFQPPSTSTHSWHDIVEAKVVLLKGGKFVYLPANDEATHLCLTDIDTDTPSPKKLPLAKLREHTALLLRARGVGDYITDIANKSLGDQAERLRLSQSHWKGLLRDAINTSDIHSISNLLKAAGCETAYWYNLQNWVSPRFIKPDNNRDFLTLLEFLGLQEDAKDILLDMMLIKRAHIRAGHTIRKQLIHLVKNDQSFRSIFADGYKLYKLDDESGNRLGVYIYDKVLEKTISVPHSDVGQPKDREVLYG